MLHTKAYHGFLDALKTKILSPSTPRHRVYTVRICLMNMDRQALGKSLKTCARMLLSVVIVFLPKKRAKFIYVH